MIKRLAVTTVGLITITLALALVLRRPAPAPFDPYAIQKAQLQYQSLQRTAERSAALEPATRFTLAAFYVTVGLVVLVGIGGGVTLLMYRAWLNTRLIAADQDGKLVVPRHLLERDPTIAAYALASFHQTRLEQARAQQRPQLVAQAQPVTPPTVPAVITPEPEPVPSIPATCELVSMLKTFDPSADRILLGVGAGGPVYRSLEQLMHTGILGSSGSGKSTSQLAIAAQLSMIDGAQLAVLDPEAATFQALARSPRLFLPFPDDGQEALDNLRALADEMTTRRTALSKAGAWDWREYNAQGGTLTPIFAFVDELAMLNQYSDTEPLLLDLARRGRKVAIFLIVASQSFKREDVGSTGLRQQFATKLLLRTGETAQGRALGLEPEWCKQSVGFREPGLAIYAPSDQAPTIIRVPYVSKTTASMLLQGGTLTTPRPANVIDLSTWRTVQRYPEAVQETVQEPESAEPAASACTASEPARTNFDGFPDPAAVLRMHAAGMSQTQILELLYGVKKGGSEAYKLAREHYRAIIADELVTA